MPLNMSVLSCASILLLLLASFQYACYARPYPTGATTIHVEDSPNHSNSTFDKRGENKTNLTDDHDQKAAGQMHEKASSSAIRKGNSDQDTTEVDVAAASSQSKRHINHSSKKKKDRVKAGSRTGGKGRGTTTVTTYKVPHTKRGEKEPGFNLDYLPPRVHPPHHN